MAIETEQKVLQEDAIRSGVEAVLNDDSKGTYFIVENNKGQNCGQLMITKEWSDWRNGTFWWIQSVYIKPQFRRQGLYRHLHEEAKRLAKLDGNVCGIRLYVESENYAAKKVYAHMGMNETNYQFFEEDWSQ
jgi:ribosomal protein S18 acetylase RimI-like enzyme